MVVPIGKLANKLSFSSSSFSNSSMAFELQPTLPTISFERNIGMDNQSGQALTNNPEVRGRNSLSSAISSRDPSIVSSGHATPYHDRMDTNPDDIPLNGDLANERLELSYETEQEKDMRISKATNQQDTSRPPAVNNKATSSHGTHEEDVINIQLPYDLHVSTEPELWSGSFHPISLYGFIEHFALDSKNIKVTLNFLAKYIQGKQVNGSKANDLNDFDGMGDAIWNFISSVYASK